jgi:two-component system sensor histidine kinase GlrK
VKPLRPNSIIQLILAGFTLAVLPLMVALIYAVVAVDRLAEQGERVVSHAVKATQGSRTLVEQITVMERNIRQYQVLGDEALFQSYEDNRKQFVTTLGWLGELPLPASLRQLLEQLAIDERGFYDHLHGAPDAVPNESALDVFPALAQKAQQVLEQSQRLIDAEVARTQSSAQEAQHTLLLLASALLPLVLLLVVFFVVLIARPLQRLDEAIRRLGAGDFSQPVTLSGSRDLQQLGERLDWMRNRLLEVEEEKLRFLRHLSHELKTPLTTIRAGSEMLREEISGKLTAQQHEIVELVRLNGVQLQKLIEDLLKFNAITQRNQVLTLEPVRLDEVIATLLAEYKVVVMTRQLTFESKLAEVTLLGDKEKLRVVVDNLLSNAIKFSPNRGAIQITLTLDDSHAQLDVCDQGPGIAPEQRARIFEAFYQGTAPYTGHVKGSGLGLSIAREYVQAHGGAIEVIDDDAAGTHMRVRLPLQQELK